MLISSMDQINYYSMPKDGYLEIDTTSPNGYSMDQQALDDEGSPTYMNEENSPKNGTKSSLYKTELCKRYSEFGSCRYGAKCQFAHGLAELRHVLRHPKYKTTKCKSYWGSGHCPYGSRCRFIHEETESMTQPPFSPQSALGGGGGGGAMNGMFFQESTTSQQFSGLSMDTMSGASTGSYLYGARSDDHALGYQKEYSLLSSFEKDTPSTPWGMGPRQPSYSSGVGVGVGVGVGAGSASPTGLAVGGADGAGFPDLQDAIDTLMRFSLAPTDVDAPGSTGVASAAPLGTIVTTPVDSRITAAGLDASEARPKKDFSLQADELWNDFPSLTTSSSSDFSDKQWPASLSLSLEGTGLFSSSTTSTSATPPLAASTTSVGNMEKPESTNGGKKDETSPRLSIFERFH